MRILVIGYGLLGSSLTKFLTERDYEVFHTFNKNPANNGNGFRLDITSQEQINRVLNAVSPEVVINTAANTNVDDCEARRYNAQQINSFGAAYVAKAVNGNAKLIHISTDYVFAGDGSTPYKEDDTVDPKGVYGKSKLAGEIRIKEHSKKKIQDSSSQNI